MELYSWTTFYLYIQIKHVYVPFILYVNCCASTIHFLLLKREKASMYFMCMFEEFHLFLSLLSSRDSFQLPPGLILLKNRLKLENNKVKVLWASHCEKFGRLSFFNECYNIFELNEMSVLGFLSWRNLVEYLIPPAVFSDFVLKHLVKCIYVYL